MRIKGKNGLTVLAFFLLSTAGAQEKKTVGLAEAIELGLKNSKQLKRNKAIIDEAGAALKEAEQKRLPDASASASYLRLSDPTVSMKSSGSGSGSNGGSPKVNAAAYGMVNAALPLYAGGRIRYGVESARLLAEATRLDAEHERGAVVRNTIEAYVNLFKARAAVDLVQENLSQARQRLKDLQNMEKNGLLARNDLMKAELQASQTELTLLDVQNSWQLANVNMNLMLGLPDSTIIMADSALLQQSITLKPLDEYVQAALHGRRDLASLDLRIKAAQKGVKAVKGEQLPALQLSAGYFAADIPNLITITNAVNMGIGVSYNLASLWKTKARVAGAEARARQLSASQEMLNDGIRLQVNRAYLNYLSAQKKIEVHQKAIEQARENFRIVKNKYNNSLATTTDLLDADLAQLQARLNGVFARADAFAAYQELLEATGTIETTSK